MVGVLAVVVLSFATALAGFFFFRTESRARRLAQAKREAGEVVPRRVVLRIVIVCCALALGVAFVLLRAKGIIN